MSLIFFQVSRLQTDDLKLANVNLSYGKLVLKFEHSHEKTNNLGF